ncbi:hypothetical protein [Pedobacter sp. MC2016-24]|uniref:hypothetical protein n=1 Tax=Pedobacter sp. MC2016-24 TaxID=2780090 RepID=UPI001882BFC1|nr:hypothetical protein [Pedobacter sp. MC2016-24]MBE9598745.1 hypothetical protein [Pedobacter sp. MC2016-24]
MKLVFTTEDGKGDGSLAFSLLIKGTINKTLVKQSFKQLVEFALNAVWMLIKLKFLPTPYFM